MANYLGVKCPVCSKRFAGADDVVVCPVCGAPHHRECYAQCGECVFNKDHISGKEWRPPADESHHSQQSGESRDSAKTCCRCSSANPNEALFCQVCGNSLTVGNSPYPPAGQGMGGWPGSPQNNQTHTYNPTYRPQQDYRDPYAGAGQGENVGEFSAKDIAMFVGPNYTYYLERFYHIEKYGRALQPNLAAAFLGFFYYFYRKMYKTGAIMLAVFLLCMLPLFLSFWEIAAVDLYQYSLLNLTELREAMMEMPRVVLYSNMFSIAIFFNFTFNLMVSLSANRNYHRQVVTKIRETMQEHRHTNEYREFLPRAGGVNRLGVVLLGASLVLGFHFLIALIMLVNSGTV